MNNTSRVVVFLLAGAAVGAAASLLFAPAKGEESRNNISNWIDGLADTIKDKAKEQIDCLVEAGKKVIGQGKSEIQNSADQMNDAVQAS